MDMTGTIDGNDGDVILVMTVTLFFLGGSSIWNTFLVRCWQLRVDTNR